jgi:hypothetical protein
VVADATSEIIESWSSLGERGFGQRRSVAGKLVSSFGVTVVPLEEDSGRQYPRDKREYHVEKSVRLKQILESRQQLSEQLLLVRKFPAAEHCFHA